MGGTDILRLVDAKATTFDHRRSAHAERGILRRDDDVAAAKQRGIAGKAAAGDHADQWHQSTELGELTERRHVETGNAKALGIAWPAAAALCKQYDRRVQLFSEPEHPVLLLVIALALGASEHG